MARQVAIPCPDCGRRFGGQDTFNRHRYIAGDRYACRADHELPSRGFWRDRMRVWHRGPMPGQESLLPLSPAEERGIPHDHATYVEGCFRCDLGRAEATPPRVLARVSDPATSHAAARAVSYRTGTQKARLLQVYLDADELGLTDEEAGIRAGLPNAWKRCSDLRRDGSITPVGVRLGSNGVEVMTCRAASEEARTA